MNGRNDPQWRVRAPGLLSGRPLPLGRFFAGALAFVGATCPGFSQPLPNTRNNFGSIGTLDLPNARMTADGALAVGASFANNTQHYFLDWQIFPWLEGSFRYSGLSHFDPAYSVYYDRSFALKARLWDETRLWPAVVIGANDAVGTGLYSGEYVAASKRIGNVDVTAGIGFGRLSGANPFTNPLSLISNPFKTRTGFPDIVPGATAFNTLFHGPNTAPFGSIVWNTPLDGLSLLAEYSSDKYTLESSRGNFKPRSQLNYGLSYDLTSETSVGLAWMYGTSISGRLSFELDPTRPQYPTKIEPPPGDAHVRDPDQQRTGILALSKRTADGNAAFTERNIAKNSFVDKLWTADRGIIDIQVRGRRLAIRTSSRPTDASCSELGELLPQDWSRIETLELSSNHAPSTTCRVPHKIAEPSLNFALYDALATPPLSGQLAQIDARITDFTALKRKIKEDATNQSLAVVGITFEAGEVTVYYSNGHYFAEADAIDRLSRVLMADLPAEFEVFRLVPMHLGIAQQKFTVLRSVAERHQEQEGNLNLFNGALTQSPAALDLLPPTDAEPTGPHLSWFVFPQFRQQLFDPNNPFAVQLLAGGVVSLELFRGFTLNAEGEMDIYNNFNTDRVSDSVLPHVRSDFVKYFTKGKNGIGEMDALYRFRASPTVFGVLKAGYLESMFAGAGGELLWRPEGARWGLGVDGYQVWQRDYDRLFGLQSYKAFTGHVSLYYQAPWYNLNFALRAGQYLARDRGLTLEISRRFSTGIEIGAFATKTNISSAQFGEGSFDKGIMIRIPLGWIAPMETQSQFAMDLRPIQRDGGQRLAGDAWLWEETRRTSEGEIRNFLSIE
jgi:hypothetical protein